MSCSMKHEPCHQALHHPIDNALTGSTVAPFKRQQVNI